MELGELSEPQNFGAPVRMGPHGAPWGPILWAPHRGFGAPFELALLVRWEVAFGTAPMSESAKHSIKGRMVEQCFYSRTHYGKCHHGQARRVLRFRRRASKIMGLQTKDLVSALSTATLASETTQHTSYKRRQTCSQKQFACTDDRKLYYVGGASSKSQHVISGDTCD